MPFKEGHDPNRNYKGRPVGSLSFTTKVREAMEKVMEGQGDTTYEQAFIKSIMKNAIVNGDATTQRLIWNYFDGMPKQAVDMNHSGNVTVEISEAIAKRYGIEATKIDNPLLNDSTQNTEPSS